MLNDVSITLDKFQLRSIIEFLHKNKRVFVNGGDFRIPTKRDTFASTALSILHGELKMLLDGMEVLDVMSFRSNKVTNATISGETYILLVGLLVGADARGHINGGMRTLNGLA